MYLSHYHLKVKPFQITPDPKFLWLGESHREALSIFTNGITNNQGLILLMGDVGTGKTTLINKLIEGLGDDTLVASVQYPGLDILDFYNFLASSFNMGKKFSNKGDFLIQFIHFLHEQHAQNKKVVLIIDEAQGLSDEILDEIRLLSNLERANVKLLNILLVGQDEMEKILAEPNNKTLADSIAAQHFLGPLKKWEVKDYIRFRLQVAGANQSIFHKNAIREIVESSQCYPRLINVLCDHALLTGYVQGKTKIDAAVIKECAKEYQLRIEDGSDQDFVETQIATEVESGSKKMGARYHWALPAILLMVLFLLVVAGYFSYLKTIGEAANTTPEEGQINPVDEISLTGNSNNQPKSAINTVPQKTNIASPGQANALIHEEDLGDASLVESSDESSADITAGDTREASPSQVTASKVSATDDNSAGLMENGQETDQVVDNPKNIVNATKENPPPSTMISALPEAPNDAMPIPTEDASAPNQVAVVDAGSNELSPEVSEPSTNGNETPTGFNATINAQKLILYMPLNAIMLPPDAYPQLESFLTSAMRSPQAYILIKSYTDSTGDTGHNNHLSQLRADAVKAFFINQALDPKRIVAVGLGENEPVASNKTTAGQNLNRRIEIELVHEALFTPQTSVPSSATEPQ